MSGVSRRKEVFGHGVDVWQWEAENGATRAGMGKRAAHAAYKSSNACAIYGHFVFALFYHFLSFSLYTLDNMRWDLMDVSTKTMISKRRLGTWMSIYSVLEYTWSTMSICLQIS